MSYFKLGTNYGGWALPKGVALNESSIVYSGGVGEDISFDILLSSLFNPTIILIDPTKKSIKHFDECKEYFKSKKPFTGSIQPDYLPYLQISKPNFDKIHFEPIGLWNEKTTLRFYKQDNPAYVSQSLIKGMFGQQYDEVPVDTIKNIMTKYNHTSIDLIKLDIEGAEVSVINNMLDDNIFPKYVCLETDLRNKNKDNDNSTDKLFRRLNENNYALIHTDGQNATFVRS